MSKGGSQTASTKPWDTNQRDQLHNFYGNQMPAILNQQLQYFPQSTVAGQSATTQGALGTLGSGAQNPALTAATNSAQGMAAGQGTRLAQNPMLGQTLGGGFLNSNPHLQSAIGNAQDATVDAYRTATAPGIDSGMARAGRYGSGAHRAQVQQANKQLGQQLGNIAQNMSYQNYGDERARQMQAAGMDIGRQQQGISNQLAAMGMAPQMAQAGYLAPQQQLQAGLLRDQHAQQQLTDQVNRFNFNQDAPFMQASRFMGLAQPSTGALQTQGMHRNPAAGMLGGAATGAGIASMMGLSNPWMAGLALGGGLLGAF